MGSLLGCNAHPRAWAPPRPATFKKPAAVVRRPRISPGVYPVTSPPYEMPGCTPLNHTLARRSS
eukprot:1582521-Lingulodinium_polyedra.AAC.1